MGSGKHMTTGVRALFHPQLTPLFWHARKIRADFSHKWFYFLRSTVSGGLLTERLAEGEFIKGVIENENAMRLIHYGPLKQ